MASLRDIRTRINSVRNTQQVTRAMKMVAAAKLRRAQERIFQTRPYAFKIGEIIAHLKRHVDPASHPLFSLDDVSPGVCLIIVTADRGLAGGFNSNLIKVAEKTINERFATERDNGDLYLICVGRKGHEHFGRRGHQLVGDYRGTFDRLTFSSADSVSDVAVEGYQSGKWDQVFLIYNEFKNTISQNRVVEPFLPIPSEHFLTPVMAEQEGDAAQADLEAAVDYIFEPSAEKILDELVPRYLGYQVWRALLESNAAEQGARMVAMDNATNNADELLKDLKLKYNRARQDAITKELIEITSGADALG
ncbi:MAG: ATP synthase F1 subunit gamma [Rhodothermales bacterium]|nr:ATP synthase F1 subunit gamma [Rhodothermales bacterium]MBO6778329.1 ATP synthase F1 subunit gamma [Rhodothermales bacterium]